MDTNDLELVQRLYAALLKETASVAEAVRDRLRRLRDDFPDLPPDVLGGEVFLRADGPHEAAPNARAAAQTGGNEAPACSPVSAAETQ
ncbi:MAG TPA: hypothetical protein VFW33_11775 [Gemmataceae bacterium]|nr:hypothetical protein [Gemmataceae bacterium]